MLTKRGWSILIVSACFLALARVLDAIEFYIIGTTFSALVLVSVIHSAVSRADLVIDREVHPPRIHVDTSGRVELSIRNKSRRWSPNLELKDRITGTRGAVITLDPLPLAGITRVSYRLPTRRRGILHLGPLTAIATGPLGLSSKSTVFPVETLVTVLPRIDTIRPVEFTLGSDPMAGALHPTALSHGGEDFYSLRRYVVGDDLRRVHWPSSARHDELMVRQEELPWQGRTTVLMDLRKASTTPESLELIVSAAASVIAAQSLREDLIRLVGTDGSDSGFAAGHAHVSMMLEHLAQTSASDDPGLHNVIARLSGTSTGGALVVIVAEIGNEDLDQLRRLNRRFRSMTLVRFSTEREAPDSSGNSASTVTVTQAHRFAESWNSTVASTRRPTSRSAPD